MELKRPRSSQTTVSVNFDEPDSLSPHPRLKFGVAECIETKTVTTTTTTKRSYPPLLVRESRPLLSLDAKEFPLARKPTPPELANFDFSIDGHDRFPWPADLDYQQSAGDDSTQATGADPALEDSFASSHSPFSKPHSPSIQASSRKALRMTSRSASPTVHGAAKKKSNRLSARSQPPICSHTVADKLRRGLSHTCRTERDGEIINRPTGSFPVTPDTTDLPPSLANHPFKLRRTNLESFETPQSEASQQQSFFDISSPTGSDSHTAFSNVATPPVTDADLEPEPFVDADESLQRSIRALHHPRPINTIVTQDASLPSPRLSPTLQASQLHTTTDDETGIRIGDETLETVGNESQNRNLLGDESNLAVMLRENESSATSRYDGSQATQATYMDSRSMLESFDAMPAEMKSFMMYQFLRRCPRKTLHLVANTVNPALNCDILQYLPLELTLHILSFLNHRDLCRAAQVSKCWRGIIDSNETGWKELFDRDGFVLATGELDRAIREGWGWQDPVGPEGCERDFSLQNRLTSTETELRSTSKPDPPLQKLRSSKRKRPLTSFTSDRSKRRASNQDNVKDERTYPGNKVHKSEGPISAANAAAIAVPDPQIGLASLRKLHLFKSLYRRHYMIRKSWTSGKVKPGHVAFAAHPRHVITCLQFDDDKIITGSDDMLIHIYDTKTGKLRRRLEGHEGGVWALQYEGNVLVSGSTDRSVRVWDIEKGLCTQVFYGHTSTVRCLQILMPTKIKRAEDGQEEIIPPKPLIITGSRDSQLRVWRLPEAGSRRYIQTGPPANDADCPYFIRTLQGHTHSVRAIAAHADTLVSGSYDNTVRMWRISTGETVHVLQGHTQKVYSVVLDIKRNRCISGSMDSFVKIWDLETGSCLHTLEGHSLLVGLLDLRDERLVSAAADSTLRIWDPETGRCQSTLTAHTGAITCFQHDGRKVISGSDRTLKMWDTRTGECLQDLLTDLSGVWQVRFDGRRCVAAVQRESLTYVEILDFGAIRDGKKPEELGKRILLNASEVQRILEEDN
ncbi:putative F-box and WD-40 domain-containing protein CDC4 [Rosellinia necatrix]|uniref:Putative F-box and WD-40 domain-containing protein CDC4 n=1 Tax=Rosellinia necatrix TaxID=77044 RepID=A0A1W2TFB4_ROSNE|nr:putative F-box and WD-40 domain-containing protein CDC4 [Rosellinia necatrix]